MQQNKGASVNRRIISVWLFLLPLAVVITACGGGGGGGGTADTISPSVTATSPVDGTTGVATDGVVTATFDERMDALTITTTTFTVRRGDSEVLGAVTYDAGTRTATFTPSGPFVLMTRYIATITTGVKDVAGNSLSANYTWSFTSRDGIWGTAALIETDNAGDATESKIAMDSSGNAIAVWGQSDGIRYNIWANRYMPGTGWGTAALIETDNAGDAFNPQIAMDSGGNAIAVWGQSDGTRYNIWANRYVAGTRWGTAALIGTDVLWDSQDPQVAMDSAGNAIVVWYHNDGTRYNIWANRFK
jgi:hypothetical protein